MIHVCVCIQYVQKHHSSQPCWLWSLEKERTYCENRHHADGVCFITKGWDISCVKWNLPLLICLCKCTPQNFNIHTKMARFKRSHLFQTIILSIQPLVFGNVNSSHFKYNGCSMVRSRTWIKKWHLARVIFFGKVCNRGHIESLTGSRDALLMFCGFILKRLLQTYTQLDLDPKCTLLYFRKNTSHSVKLSVYLYLCVFHCKSICQIIQQGLVSWEFKGTPNHQSGQFITTSAEVTPNG